MTTKQLDEIQTHNLAVLDQKIKELNTDIANWKKPKSAINIAIIHGEKRGDDPYVINILRAEARKIRDIITGLKDDLKHWGIKRSDLTY